MRFEVKRAQVRPRRARRKDPELMPAYEWLVAAAAPRRLTPPTLAPRRRSWVLGRSRQPQTAAPAAPTAASRCGPRDSLPASLANAWRPHSRRRGGAEPLGRAFASLHAPLAAEPEASPCCPLQSPPCDAASHASLLDAQGDAALAAAKANVRLLLRERGSRPLSIAQMPDGAPPVPPPWRAGGSRAFGAACKPSPALLLRPRRAWRTALTRPPAPPRRRVPAALWRDAAVGAAAGRRRRAWAQPLAVAGGCAARPPGGHGGHRAAPSRPA